MSDYPSDRPVIYKSLDFLGFPAYRVGDDGSVWSCIKHECKGLPRGKGFWYLSDTWRELTLFKTNYGYQAVNLYSAPGKPKIFRVHTLVLTAFVGHCPDGMECRHFPDRNPENNRLANLQWGTHTDNLRDKILHGTHAKKVTWKQVLEIRRLAKQGVPRKEIATQFGISNVYVAKIVQGRLRKTA